ncbi:hypothetical protein [Nonomuraea wenchangensis]|uniref:hypothetical protein n=1 Tax=Nonomuraea wenchangensis TaxID=568860 RepID=UPI00331F93AD
MNAKDMWPDWTQPGGPVVVQAEAAAIAERIVDALAGAGMLVSVREPADSEIDTALVALARQGRIAVTVAADGGDVVHALRLAGFRIVRAALPEETSS